MEATYWRWGKNPTWAVGIAKTTGVGTQNHFIDGRPQQRWSASESHYQTTLQGIQEREASLQTFLKNEMIQCIFNPYIKYFGNTCARFLYCETSYSFVHVTCNFRFANRIQKPWLTLHFGNDHMHKFRSSNFLPRLNSGPSDVFSVWKILMRLLL